MNSSQYTAIARWADQHSATVAAMHHLPGATPTSDGAWVVLYHENRDRSTLENERATAFSVVSLHVETTMAASRRLHMPARDQRVKDGLHVEELSYDEPYRSHVDAMREFYRAVLNDAIDL